MFFIKKKPSIIVAIEVGSSKVAVAVAEMRDEEALCLRGVAEVPSSGVRKGEIVDFQNAQKDIASALEQAEAVADVEIEQVYVAITGTHIQSKTIRVKTSTEDEDHLVTQAEVDELDQMAQEQAIPEDHLVLHQMRQHFILDNRERTTKAVNLSSRTVEANYLMIHGLGTRLMTTVRAICELDIEANGAVLSAYASSQAVLTSDMKKQGAVVIDLGAGTSDYVAYVDGSVAHTGVLGLGGDHLTHDISLGLQLPYLRAEELKKAHGRLNATGIHPDERIKIERSINNEEREIYVHSLARVMELRQREILEYIRRDLDRAGVWDCINAGVFLTGGASRVQGLQSMAAEVFPVSCRLFHEFDLEGDQTHSRRPDLATVLGVLRYARKHELENPPARGWARLSKGFAQVLSSMGLL